MTIILPIIFFAACVGLFAKRITASHWAVMALMIALVIGYHFLKR